MFMPGIDSLRDEARAARQVKTRTMARARAGTTVQATSVPRRGILTGVSVVPGIGARIADQTIASCATRQSAAAPQKSIVAIGVDMA